MVFKPDPNLSSGAAIYKGASNKDIYTAFKEIAGIKTLPTTNSPMYQKIKGPTSLSGQSGYIIRVSQKDGSTVVLRNFSFSQDVSKARFIIEIQKPAGMNKRALELKFQ